MNRLIKKALIAGLLLAIVYSFQVSFVYEKHTSSLPCLEAGYIDGSMTIEIIDLFPIGKEVNDLDSNNEYDLSIGNSTIKKLTREIKNINSDTIGWIYIPDSNINYPILYREGDNQYYLSHDVYGSISSSGSIFLDASSEGSFSDINIISGHSMKNKTMFGNLLKYKEQNWTDDHCYIYIYDLFNIKKYKVFACILLNAENEGVKVKFDSMKERLDYLNEIKNRSKITPLEIDNPMDIIVLNTCSYEAYNFRYLVFATDISMNGDE